MLEDLGHEMNPYNPCVWNKMVLGTQLTLMFRVDDVLMAHALSNVVTDHVKLLDEKYGRNDPLSVTRGKLHEYLWMTLDFRNEGSAAFTQHDAIKKFWSSLPNNLRSKHESVLAPENSFKLDPNSTKVDVKLKDEHHTAIAKCLYFSQRSRPDIQLATGFHCTRIKEPTQ